MDRELDLLQNSRIAGYEIQFADERRNAWRVSDDSYRGVICLIGAGECGTTRRTTSDELMAAKAAFMRNVERIFMG